MNTQAENFFQKKSKWHDEYNLLRTIVLKCKLEEDFKWKHPCYTLDGNNVVLIHGFKDYCALLFFKGVLMKDPKSLLIQQTKNVQDRRQMRYTSVEEITQQSKVIEAYIREAVTVEKSGVKVTFKKTNEFEIPEELSRQLKMDPAFRKAFESLTPGRQRGYLLYISSAKQSSTRESRIEKYYEHILAGKGLDDI
ncbi:MAG: YdeI/OmpD-associated family protein [Flavobacteriales bacterium]|nr:YdeI/OmpD-associated family protein [Flavobacteriales bacterium]